MSGRLGAGAATGSRGTTAGRDTGARALEGGRVGNSGRLGASNAAGTRNAGRGVGPTGATRTGRGNGSVSRQPGTAGGGLGNGRGSAGGVASGRNARGGPAASGVAAGGLGGSPGLGNGRPASGYSHHDPNYNYGHYNNRNYYGFGNGFYWDVGFRFGFGYGLGWFGWGGWGYRNWCWPYFATGFWYPWTGYCHYPFFWSYNAFSPFRGFGGAWAPAADTFYIDAPGYAADPYVDDVTYLDPGVVDAPLATGPQPLRRVTLAPREVLAEQSFASGMNAGRNADEAIAAGQRLLAAGRPGQAAEAFRQAYLQRQDPSTLRALGLALVVKEDWQMASWAIQKGSTGGQRDVLDFVTEASGLLGGPRLEAAAANLERYLIDNPNDEASNFLLGTLYVASGRDYAAYVLLTRLADANYQRSSTEAYLDQARQGLRKR